MEAGLDLDKGSRNVEGRHSMAQRKRDLESALKQVAQHQHLGGKFLGYEITSGRGVSL